MTNEEAITIKSEILKKEGTVNVGGLSISDVVLLSDIIEIINSHIEKGCSNCKYWLLDKNDEKRKCKYCYDMDEWVAESEDKA